MKRIGWVLLLASACAGAADQQPAGNLNGYSAMSVDAGYAVSSLSGKFDVMKDGVRITLLSNDPAKKPVPIVANEVHFTYAGKDAKQPSRIELEGKVVIEHPEATVRAEKADWDFDKGLLTFTGSPTIDSPQIQGLRGDKVVLNFKEDRFEVFGGKIKNYPLSGMGGAPGEPAAGPAPAPAPQVLVDSVKDWPGFVAKLKEQAQGENPSPGKRLFALLDGKTQKALIAIPAEPSSQDKDLVVAFLNRILSNPKFYVEPMWKGVELPPAASALLGKTARSLQEHMALNRLLLEAAFPGMIAGVGAQ